MAISALPPYPRKARTRSRRQIKKIAALIKHFGFLKPVLIDQDHQIIAGHGRVKSAGLLGWSEGPVLRIEHLSGPTSRP